MRATIKVFDLSSPAGAGNPIRQILPFKTCFRGGVNVSTGRFHDDAIADIIAAAGPGSASRTQVFDGASGRLLWDFYPFTDASKNASVRVVGKDTNHDGAIDYLFAAQGTDGRNREVRRLRPQGTYVDRLLQTDPDFGSGLFLA
jgi:hypothetical protein